MHLEAFEVEADEVVSLRLEPLSPRRGLSQAATWTLLLAVFAALLAGLYPALKMSKVPPAVVLREE